MSTKPTIEDMARVVLEAIGWQEISVCNAFQAKWLHGYSPEDDSRISKIKCPDLETSLTAHFAEGGPVEWCKKKSVYIALRPFDVEAFYPYADNVEDVEKYYQFDYDIKDPVHRICHALIEAEFAAVGKIMEG